MEAVVSDIKFHQSLTARRLEDSDYTVELVKVQKIDEKVATMSTTKLSLVGFPFFFKYSLHVRTVFKNRLPFARKKFYLCFLRILIITQISQAPLKTAITLVLDVS